MQQGYNPNQQPVQRRRRYQATVEQEAAPVQQPEASPNPYAQPVRFQPQTQQGQYQHPAQYPQQPCQPTQTKQEQPAKENKRFKKAKPKKKKWLIALIVLAVIFVLGSLPDQKATTPAHQAAVETYGDHLIDFVDSESANGSTKITYNIVSGWSNETTRSSFWYEAHETIKALWELKQQGKADFGSIRITAMAEYKDAVGNTTKDRAIDIAVNTDFLSKINWAAFTSDDLEQLAGTEFSYFCHPEFQ